MEQGFCPKGSGLWYVRPEKVERFAFKDEDLTKSRLQRLIPAKAEYYVAFHCEQCHYYAVDYEKSLSRNEANALAVATI